MVFATSLLPQAALTGSFLHVVAIVEFPKFLLLINVGTLFRTVVCSPHLHHQCALTGLKILISTTFADVASKVESFFSPAILFIQRWLPLFYVPSLVMVPIAVQGIPAGIGAKIGAILRMDPHL